MGLTIEQIINLSVAVGLIIFMLWLAPTGVGFKPFFWDLREAGKNLPRDKNGKVITDLRLIREINSH